MGESWQKIKAFAEEHPFALGVIIFIGGAVIVYFLFRGGSAPASTGANNAGYYNALAAATESGNQLQATQAALQAHSADVQAGLLGQQDTNATQLAITKANNDAAVTIASQQITEQSHVADLSAQTAQLESTLAAQVAASNNNTQVQIAQLGAGTADLNITTAGNVEMASIAAQKDVASASIAAGAASTQLAYQATIASISAQQAHQATIDAANASLAQQTLLWNQEALASGTVPAALVATRAG